MTHLRDQPPPDKEYRARRNQSLRRIYKRVPIPCSCRHMKHAHLNYVGPCFTTNCPCPRFNKLT